MIIDTNTIFAADSWFWKVLSFLLGGLTCKIFIKKNIWKGNNNRSTQATGSGAMAQTGDNGSQIGTQNNFR